MRKRLKKLTLSRETLRCLNEGGQLAKAVGGGQTGQAGPACASDPPNCNESRRCPDTVYQCVSDLCGSGNIDCGIFRV